MYCNHCGKKVDDAAYVCPHCGVKIGTNKKNSMATAGLVCGIIPYTCLLGVIFGIIGIRISRKVQGNGKGRAIAGLVSGIFWFVFFFFIIFANSVF